MELVNTNDDDSFDPTPRLKSTIKFISFNESDENCVFCGEKYIDALLCFWQKYCKKCLSSYINVITNDIYLDMYYAMELECNEHEISRTKVPQNIQECCANCLRILCFKQIRGYLPYIINLSNIVRKNYTTIYDKVIESEKDCKLCGKTLVYIGTNVDTMSQFLCSDCYLTSSGFIESTLAKKKISVFYLPWWNAAHACDACHSRLTSTSDCQKYCSNCFIFYIGCRYCLTTNIIFGHTFETQCIKCKRISPINRDFDDFLFNNTLICDNLDYDYLKLAAKVEIKSIYFTPKRLLQSIFEEKNSIKQIKWIPYSQFKDVKEMTKGGYGTIYKATYLYCPTNGWTECRDVILKRFKKSKNTNNINEYFLNELKSFQQCSKEEDNSHKSHIIKIYGFTKDPELDDYILVIKYASEGDLHKYLQKDFINITWNKQKLLILWQISEGLEQIHNKKFMHRDFHSGNILFDQEPSGLYNSTKRYQWKVADLGLSQSLNNNNTSPNNEVYGVIPYIAPEIFKGSDFSKAADVYSLGMIMWELTTGCKPFDNVKHDHILIYKILDGKRPKITEDTPECYANLMKSCWDPDPKKRPSIKKIRTTFGGWFFRSYNKAEFDQAEKKRQELLQLKKIGPEFAEERHSEAIYTSRPLSTFISKCSSINSTMSQGYKTRELEFDIDFERSSSRNIKKRSNDISLNVETYDNSVGKRIKTSSNDP